MRREITKTIPTFREGRSRDAGKQFLIKEMSANQASKWAWRMALAVKGTNAQIPAEFAALGIVGIAIRGINSILAADIEWSKIEPLLDELMACVHTVQIHEGITVPLPLVLDGEGADVEDYETIEWLRAEVLSLHVGFSVTEAILSWITSVSKGVEGLSSPSASTSPQ